MLSMRALGIVLVVLLLAAGGAYFYLDWSVTTPIDPAQKETVVFEVPKGATLNQVGGALVKAGFVRSALPFKIWVKLHPSIEVPKAGKHEISKAMNVSELLFVLASKPLSEDVPLVIVPGWRVRDTDAFLSGKGMIDAGEYLKAAADKTRFQLAFPVEGDTLSGYLWPETYMVPPGKLDVDKLIQRQLDAFNEAFYVPNRDEIEKSGRSLQQIVIVASLLEREEPKPEMRPDIAGIIYKRLDKRIPLGVDATSRYTLDDWNDRAAFLKMLNDPDDPYNTRNRPGLPPGPIGEPALDSLLGALRPKRSPYLYYLHDKDHNVHFARTGDEHEANRRKYNVY